MEETRREEWKDLSDESRRAMMSLDLSRPLLMYWLMMAVDIVLLVLLGWLVTVVTGLAYPFVWGVISISVVVKLMGMCSRDLASAEVDVMTKARGSLLGLLFYVCLLMITAVVLLVTHLTDWTVTPIVLAVAVALFFWSSLKYQIVRMRSEILAVVEVFSTREEAEW